MGFWELMRWGWCCLGTGESEAGNWVLMEIALGEKVKHQLCSSYVYSLRSPGDL